MIETPGYGSSLDIKNSGPMEFPIKANVQPFFLQYEPERFKLVQGENSLWTVSISDFATRYEIIIVFFSASLSLIIFKLTVFAFSPSFPFFQRFDLS